jgi:hypothetical protein
MTESEFRMERAEAIDVRTLLPRKSSGNQNH